MKVKSRQNPKATEDKNQKVRPEVAKLIDEISKKYAKVWQDLAKI